MTNEEIFGAQKLIAEVRIELSMLAGTADDDKLPALVRDNVPHIKAQLHKLKSLDLFTSEEYEDSTSGLAVMMVLAEGVDRCPDYKAKLVRTVPAKTFKLFSVLGEIERYLAQVILAASRTPRRVAV